MLYGRLEKKERGETKNFGANEALTSMVPSGAKCDQSVTIF